MDVTRITCPSCTTKLQSAKPLPVGKAIKCFQCGHVFPVPATEAPSAPAAPVAVPASPPAAPQSEPSQETAVDNARPSRRPAKKPKRKKSHAGLIVGFIGCSVLVVVGFVAGGALWLSNYLLDNKQTQDTGKGHKDGHPDQDAVAGKGELDDWLQNLEEAKRQAAKDNKDILLLFDASDWNEESGRLAKEVLTTPRFKEAAAKNYVLVHLDFPQGRTAGSRVQDQVLNSRLRQEYAVSELPTLLLADAKARPSGRLEGYKHQGMEPFLKELEKLRAHRIERDRVLSNVEQAKGSAKVPAAREALDLLVKDQALNFFEPLLDEWEKLARQEDPHNEKGFSEIVFETLWMHRLSKLGQFNHADRAKHVQKLDQWKKTCRFQDPDRGARVFLVACDLLRRDGQEEAALNYVEEGMACEPTDRRLRQQLAFAGALLGMSSGTGFVVAPGGYILTNHHVAGEARRLVVRLPGQREAVPAELVAQDAKRDMALIRLKGTGRDLLKPLTVAGQKPIGRGETVAALGFALGDAVGSGVKFTKGVVSALPEVGNDHMLMLDVKINPGNSGGPVCDTFGNVVGMVTAKSFAFGPVESYGMALPAKDLEAFLKKHLKDYKPAPAASKPLPLEEVDRMVSPSVLMILKSAKKGATKPGDD